MAVAAGLVLLAEATCARCSVAICCASASGVRRAVDSPATAASIWKECGAMLAETLRPPTSTSDGSSSCAGAMWKVGRAWPPALASGADSTVAGEAVVSPPPPQAVSAAAARQDSSVAKWARDGEAGERCMDKVVPEVCTDPFDRVRQRMSLLDGGSARRVE